jgi:acyl dehydratase
MRIAGVLARAFDPVEFVIGDRLSVQNWGRAMHTNEDAFLHLGAARAAGWAGRPVPLGMYAFFLTVPTSALVGELGFVWGRTLAAGIKAEVGRVASEDEWVSGQTFADVAHEKIGRDGATRQFLRLRTEFRDANDQLVNRWQTLFIEKIDGPVTVPPAERPAPEVGAPSFQSPASAVPVIPLDGQLPQWRIGPLDRFDFARMSVAMDDPNLVHLDDMVAAEAGFSTVIGSGGYVLGAFYEAARQWAGLDRIRAVDMRQLRPFAPGAELCVSAEVVSKDDPAGHGLALLQAALTDGGQNTIATASVTVQL